MDISGTNLFNLRKKVAAAIDVSPEKLDKMITPIEKVYAIVDHTRCLAYMLGDCIVPSNVREGYLARLVIRRTLRMMNDLKIQEPLADLIEQQTRIIGNRKFEQDIAVVREIVDRETEKYASTLERGTRIVQKVAKTYKAKSQRVPLAEIMTLYDSHGIQPEMIKDIATKEGAVVDLPDNFYSMVADMHSESKKEAEEDKTAKYAERAAGTPAHEETLLRAAIGYRVRGGRAGLLRRVCGHSTRPSSTRRAAASLPIPGRSSVPRAWSRVDGVVKVGEVILHHITGGVLRRGERVKGMVDEERRWSLMRHHTATHILLHATKGSARGPHPPGRGTERQREFRVSISGTSSISLRTNSTASRSRQTG